MAKIMPKMQRSVLEAIPDWSADWEVSQRLGDASIRGVRIVLNRLVLWRLAEWHPANKTYRIGSLGRKALESKP